MAIGGSANDSATLTGVTGSAGGTVTYTVYSTSTCSGVVATLGPVTVTNGAVPNSPNWTATVAAGTYYFVANYSGDANNTAAQSGCGAEAITVNTNAPTISTQLSASSVAIGGSANDSATLSAATAGAGGTVTYTVYSTSTCSGVVATLGPVTVTNGAVPNSPNWTATVAAGTYYFVANYSGDANNTAAQSGCGAEAITVNTNAPTISTQLSASSVAIGGSANDSATLSAATAGAGGTVTYTVYSTSTCSGVVATLGPVTVTNGAVPNSPNWTATVAAGTYYFVANYSGDANNTVAQSGCGAEAITVNTNAPTISTQLSASSVAIGGSANDSATLTGVTGSAGGTVTYTVYSTSTCSGVVATLGPVTVTNGAVPNSPNWTATVAAGTYYFVANYSGDANNTAAQSGCGAEAITVNTNAPTISTQLSASSVAIGGSANDSATLSAATAGAGGTVTYTVYSTSTCSGVVATLGPVTVTNGAVPNSPNWTATVAAGTYYFVANYSGDANNTAAQSGCGAEAITVNTNAPTISTQLSASSVAIGGSANDSATLSAATAGAGGTVTYTVYSTSTCSGVVATLGPVTVTNGAVPNSPNWTATVAAGTYYFVANYSGDANNTAAQSGCGAEAITVNTNAPTISTQLSASSVVVSGTVYDTATLSGAAAGVSGTVTYTVYSTSTCSGVVATLGPVTVTNGAVPNSPNWTATVAAGTYYFVANYSGDANNTAAQSGCGAEAITVSSAISGSLAITNAPGNNSGRPMQGDQIIVTFATPPTPSLFCSAWTGNGSHSLSGPNVVVTAAKGTPYDSITGVTDSTDCSGGFHFGSINLGQSGYFNSSVTFGGASLTCAISLLGGCTTVSWNGTNTLTITLGAPTNGQPTQNASSVAVYTPDPNLGFTGTISSPNQTHF